MGTGNVTEASWGTWGKKRLELAFWRASAGDDGPFLGWWWSKENDLLTVGWICCSLEIGGWLGKKWKNCSVHVWDGYSLGPGESIFCICSECSLPQQLYSWGWGYRNPKGIRPTPLQKMSLLTSQFLVVGMEVGRSKTVWPLPRIQMDKSSCTVNLEDLCCFILLFPLE